MKSSAYKLALILAITCTAACTQPGEENQKSAGGGGAAIPSGAFSTNCGTVVNGKLRNPPSPSDGFKSPVKVLGPNLLSINLPTGPLMVKLHNLGAPSNNAKASAAMRTLEDLATGEEGIFIPADSECSSALGSKTSGALGQVFTASGRSYSEALIARGQSQVSTDPCGGSLLKTCYEALEEDTAEKVAGEIGKLLWKPVSDSTGKLAVHSAPYGASVKVNGELGVDQGAGNGYGSLARFSKPGCAYGNNVQVQVFNSKGAAYTFNGATTITIPSGCSRTCLVGGTIAQCSK